VLNDTPQIEVFTTYIKSIDPYKHPVVMHTAAQSQNKYLPLLGNPEFDGPSIQRDMLLVFDISLQWRELSVQYGHPWIVTNDEQGPASEGVMPDSVIPNNQDVIRKEVLWGNIMAVGTHALLRMMVACDLPLLILILLNSFARVGLVSSISLVSISCL